MALVSDDPEKLRKLGKRYKVEHLLGYDGVRRPRGQSDAIDAVYIALPNHLHHAYTLRAARAGMHVLCEKPMAVTVDECHEMIEAAEANRVQLMIAYRLHFERGEPRTRSQIAHSRQPRRACACSTRVFCMQVEEGNIRLQAATRRRPAVRHRHLLHQRRALPVPRRADRGGRAHGDQRRERASTRCPR